eukprot:scaffold1898_cov89-Skeletonema_dohrnii-CCMP3373.AAC.2
MNGPLEAGIAVLTALDTIWCNSSAGHPKLGLIRSPTTSQHGRYEYKEHEQCNISVLTELHTIWCEGSPKGDFDVVVI